MGKKKITLKFFGELCKIPETEIRDPFVNILPVTKNSDSNRTETVFAWKSQRQ